jgi:hypothetical protein
MCPKAMGPVTIPEEIITEVLRLYRDVLIPSGKFPAVFTYELMKTKLHRAKCVYDIFKIWSLFYNNRHYDELHPADVIHHSIEQICMLLETISGVKHEIQEHLSRMISRESLITMISDEIMNSIV